MGKLKIKEIYQNKVVKRDLKGFGTVSVDTKKLEEKDFEKWKKRGLEIFIEESEPKPKQESKEAEVEAEVEADTEEQPKPKAKKTKK